MEWEKPEFTEVKMDAEIGSYQLVDGDRDVAPHVEDDTNGNTWWGDYQGLAGARATSLVLLKSGGGVHGITQLLWTRQSAAA